MSERRNLVTPPLLSGKGRAVPTQAIAVSRLRLIAGSNRTTQHPEEDEVAEKPDESVDAASPDLVDESMIEDEDGAIDEWLDAQTEAVDDVPDIEDIDAEVVEDEADDD
jgi:hypothetical protein